MKQRRFTFTWNLANFGVVLVVSTTAMMPGCSPAGAEPSAKVKKEPRVVPVTVAPVVRRKVERTVDAVGTLRGWEQVTIGSKRTGRVIRVLHEMGDRVKPGEPLVVLDPVDARLAADQAESRYLAELAKLGLSTEQADRFIEKFGISEELISGKPAQEAIEKVAAVIQVRVARDKAQQNLNRQIALNKKGASTMQELEDHENDYLSARAAYDNAKATARNVIAMALANRVARDQARQMLEDMTIKAPIPRLLPEPASQTSSLAYAITKRSVSEGQMIKEGEAVFEVLIENPLRLWINIPERYSESVRVGQPVRIRVASHPETSFEGVVARINPSVEPVSRTFQVEARVPNERGLLRPGGFAKATIVTDSETEAAVVPIDSIVRFAGVTKLFLIEDGKARSINDIVTGVEGKGWVEVSSKGLPRAGQVVVTGQGQLADKTPVVIRTPEAPVDHSRPAESTTAETPGPASQPAPDAVPRG